VTLRQLRYLREIVRQAMNISSAAATLHTSQPGVSRQLQLLERELGVELLVRRRNRVLALTQAGHTILDVAERMLNEADNIRLIAEDLRSERGGRLRLATSHLHARYTLPSALKAFARRYPDVQLHVLQSDPDAIAALIERGEVDVGVSTEVGAERSGLVSLPSTVIRRSAIMPRGHPLAQNRRLGLSDLARYPLVGYHQGSRGGQIVGAAFTALGIEVRFVVNAADTDVIKAYVAEGLGIAVIPSIAFDRTTDTKLKAMDVTDLFPRSRMTVSLRRAVYPRRYLTDFIAMVDAKLSRTMIERAFGLTAA